MERLQEDLRLRGMNIDVATLKEKWQDLRAMESKRSAMEEKKRDLSARIKILLEKGELTAEQEKELNELKMQAKLLKQDFKAVKNSMSELEGTVLSETLKLPNEIDEKTPSRTPVVLKSVGAVVDVPENDRQSHLEIGRRLGILEYRNPILCYLCDDAALFELGALSLAGQILSESDTIRIAGCDFSRSLVVEGSGANHLDPTDAFMLENDNAGRTSNRLHLVGGASLQSFLAMHTKQMINPHHFPVKYFATGRQYTPFPEGSTPIGLFTVCQASVAHVFALFKEFDSSEYRSGFENIVDTVAKIYDDIAAHYRIVLRPASELRPWEKLRVSFEMWSAFSQQYVEVGHLSSCGQYFSKRLLIAYQTADGRDFPAAISGTVLSVPRLLGCLLEENPEKFVIPTKVAQHMPFSRASPETAE